MHKTGTLCISYKLGSAEITNVIPLSIGTLGASKRVRQTQVFQIRRGNIAHTLILSTFQPRFHHHIGCKVISQYKLVSNIRPAFIRRAGYFEQSVGNVLTVNYRFVARHGPRRCGPDHDKRIS